MKSNSFLNKKRKNYLNLLRNLISKSREWKGLKIKDNPLLKSVSNGDECRDLIRDDDRLLSEWKALKIQDNPMLNTSLIGMNEEI
ncbi:hypothetical protein Gogos_003249 [Gossypium gossypioides]|uniref:Uncharacterized protein n=1 Tax=Gossypium gossypioides TaxID=34282 RepID=A0A7J9CLC4_GOSGO|nr:hypothetical protein [Gossypium gossypioides]